MENSPDRILYQLKRRGSMTVRELADTLDMTTMGVRQHLQQMQGDGLVEPGVEEARQRGRPVRPWSLTSAGHARFPDAHAQATVELIASIRDVLGDDKLDEVVAHRARSAMDHYAESMLTLRDLESRVRKLAALREAEGYMARVEADGDDWLLIEDHCPICVAASHCQGFCQGELESFQQLLSGFGDVRREEHLLSGARRCTYRVIPTAAVSDPAA